MLTAKQVKELPYGFNPIISTSRSSYGKSRKYRTGTQSEKVYQTLPNGKVILRLQETQDRKVLRGFIGTYLGKNNKWMVRNKEKKD